MIDAEVTIPGLYDPANRKFMQSPTVVAGDVVISLDNGPFQPLAIVPTVLPSGAVRIVLSEQEQVAEVGVIDMVDQDEVWSIVRITLDGRVSNESQRIIDATNAAVAYVARSRAVNQNPSEYKITLAQGSTYTRATGGAVVIPVPPNSLAGATYATLTLLDGRGEPIISDRPSVEINAETLQATFEVNAVDIEQHEATVCGTYVVRWASGPDSATREIARGPFNLLPGYI